jgi:flagellar biosynthesis/type III secretory pathway protein FliH
MGLIKKKQNKSQEKKLSLKDFDFEIKAQDTKNFKNSLPRSVIKGARLAVQPVKLSRNREKAFAKVAAPHLSSPDEKITPAEEKKHRHIHLKEIEVEKKTILEQAYQEGYKKGIEEGRSVGKAEYGQQSQELLATIGQAIKEKNEILNQSKSEILNLSLQIAQQIIKSEISLNPAVCMNIIAEALNKITDKDRVIIRVNRADLDYVKSNSGKLSKQIGDVKNLIIQEDYRVEQGGCIIETNLGYIDSTVTTKLDSIKKAIFQVYDEESHESERQKTQKGN